MHCPFPHGSELCTSPVLYTADTLENAKDGKAKSFSTAHLAIVPTVPNIIPSSNPPNVTRRKEENILAAPQLQRQHVPPPASRPETLSRQSYSHA